MKRMATDLRYRRERLVLDDMTDIVLAVMGVASFGGLGGYTLYGWLTGG